MQKIALISMTLALSSCASIVDGMDKAAGLGQVTVSKSDFDGATIIKASPNHLFNPNGGLTPVKTMLGATWTNQAPDVIAITMTDQSSVSSGKAYVVYTGLAININGQITEYKAGRTNFDSANYNQISKTIATSSRSSVIIPMSVFESMLNAESCKIRVLMLSSYEDASCSHDRITGGKATAILTYRQMLNTIKAQK